MFRRGRNRTCILLLAAAVFLGCVDGEDRFVKADEAAAEGVLLAREGRLEEAARQFGAATALDPDNLRARYNGGLAALELGRAAEARTHLEHFLSLRPDDALGHLHLARALMAGGDRAAALAAISTAVEKGLDQPEELAAAEFAPFQGELRYVQALALVAQRGGVRPTDDRGRLLVGGQPVRSVDLPRSTSAIACAPDDAPPLPE